MDSAKQNANDCPDAKLLTSQPNAFQNCQRYLTHHLFSRYVRSSAVRTTCSLWRWTCSTDSSVWPTWKRTTCSCWAPCVCSSHLNCESRGHSRPRFSSNVPTTASQSQTLSWVPNTHLFSGAGNILDRGNNQMAKACSLGVIIITMFIKQY